MQIPEPLTPQPVVRVGGDKDRELAGSQGWTVMNETEELEKEPKLEHKEPVVYESDGYVIAVVKVDKDTGTLLSEEEIS
jgi:hypothetical protein